MTAERALPWTDLVAAFGERRFADIRTALDAGKVDAASHDAFILVGPVGALLRELMPREAPAEEVHAYATLLRMLFWHWDAGRPVRSLDRAALERALSDPAALSRPPDAPGVTYLQLPERMVWAAPQPGAPHEPLDGCFVTVSAGGVEVLAVLGFRPERGGFTTVEARGTLPLTPPGPRPDGNAPFASTLPAGERAGLRSVTTDDELLALAFLALAASSPAASSPAASSAAAPSSAGPSTAAPPA